MANPADLNTTPQPDTDKNFFNFKAVGLKINKTYAIKFQWIYDDLTLSDWSPGFFITTSNETAPAVPSSASVPGSATGSIPVTLSAFPTNAKRVDVIITNGIFGTATVAHSFTTAGTITIAAPAGSYIVQLRSVSPTGVTSTVGTTFTITISDAGETIQAPTNPNGFTSKRILAGIEVSWAGTYANSTFTGFEAINIYAGNSATATNGTYEQVGVLTGNNVKNTIVIPLGTYVAYGQAVYIHAAGVNKANPPVVGTIQANVTNQTLGPGKATDADINDGAVSIPKLASNVLFVDSLKAGTLSATSYIRSGSKNGARIEISSATTNITTETDPITNVVSNLTYPVKPGITIYASNATTEIFRADYSGGLAITGSLAATSISTSSGKFTVSSGGVLTATDVNLTGEITASSGSIGNWKINAGVLKSGSESFPSVLLDPVESKIHLRGSAGASDTGNVIKMDTTNGIRVGPTGSPTFTVAMDGSLSATNATISKSSGSNTIILDGTSLRALGNNGATTSLGYDGSIKAYENSSSEFNYGTTALVQVATNVSSAYLTPGGISFTKQVGLFGTKTGEFTIQLEGNYLKFASSGVDGVFWGYAGTGVYTTYNVAAADPFIWKSSQIGNTWQAGGFGGFRPLGVDPFGQQVLGPRMFSGSATSNSTINTDIDANYSPTTRVNGDLYFSTA